MALIKDLNKALKKRERVFVRLQLCYDLIKELPAKKSVFTARCTELPNLYLAFEDVSQQIDDINEQLEDPSSKVDTAAPSKQFDILYYEIKSAYDLIIASEKEVSNIQSGSDIVSTPKLPQIDINKFRGQLEQFSSFKSLFDNLIHKSSIAPIEKFSYLKSLLEGPALSIVEGIPFDPEHYQLAYDTLVDRYTNPRVLACHYLNKILDQQPIKSPSLSNLRQILDLFNINVQTLKSLNIQDLSDFVFLQLALRLLDNTTRKAFELENKSVKFPTLETLINFLRAQCSVYELTQQNVQSTNTKSTLTPAKKTLISTQPTSSGFDKTEITTVQPLSYSKCPMNNCTENHPLYRCGKFLALSPTERYKIVRTLKRCFSCLGSHMLPNCASVSSCRHCKSKRHHSLLHENKTSSPEETQPTQSLGQSDKPAQSLSCGSTNNLTILSTAQVLVQDSLGNWQRCRAVIDGGSQVNFITKSLAQSLSLPVSKCSVDIIGIGQSSNLTAKGSISCTVASRYDHNNNVHLEAVIIPKISSNIPVTALSDTLVKKFSSLTLADPQFNIPAKVDMLLGAQAFTDIMTSDFTLIKGKPSALHTIFGWILMGDVPMKHATSKSHSFFVSHKIDQLLQQFWESEAINLPKHPNPEDQSCEIHFQSTISRDETGRYIASLPFKDNVSPDLGSTREIALRKYHQLENRFKRYPELKETYLSCLQDYVNQGHLKPALEPSSYVMTHHGVRKETSTTSPLRIVFNASELSDTNQSLNKSLLVGPKLQTDIGCVITNFRLFPIALTCDIKQMYRAIRLSPRDCKYQHIFWRPDPLGPIEEWELQRLTFGVSCSPFIAQRTLKQLVLDEGNKYPLASEALTNACYIDDLVCGATTESQALELYSELNQLLNLGGFNLHKWSSSSLKVLHSIPEHHRETPHSLGSTKSIKVLGLEWNPSDDCFHYAVTTINNTPTKRNVLSQVARIYDVNGYISPVIFTLKHLLQLIWLEKLDWDDPLPPSLCSKWNKLIQELPLLTSLRIPRYILSKYITIQLIGFCDASKIGMCAALYLRVECEDNQIVCNLLQSKTRVAPLKTLTIPRLELCAALLLSQIVTANQQLTTKLKVTEMFLFSDSMNVLGWLKTPPHLLETFISNRVGKILENTTVGVWHHVNGDQNPADYGTRGLLPSNLINLQQWWNGPQFLYENESSFLPLLCTSQEELCDVNVHTSNTLTTQVTPQNDLCEWINRFSSLMKLQNVMGYILRFIHNTRNTANKLHGPLSLKERTNSLTTIIKIVQNQHYSSDIENLKKGKQCSSSLRTLSPFLSHDILMVGGRLQHAPISDKAKHPYLIPAKSHLAALICDHYHLYSLHGGPKLVQSLIQRHYWIPGARNLIRKRVFRCLPCYKLQAKPMQPYMADIPISRFHQGRCFENVGLDFAGPFLVKESIRRNARLSKCYIALFICMSVKAIHLELVHSLTTESCLAAIDRFTSRRGLPRNIYSDQGRNFVGAANQLKEVYELLKTSQTQFSNHLAKQEITWNFNPPYAANFGGLWEAGVKSVKHHLKRILDTNNFTAEEFSTLLCRIEAILNSRPLCPLPASPNDGFDFLSPGHFLIGGPLLCRPEDEVTQEPLHHLTRWKQITHATQRFWKQWTKDYLHSQIQRPKWNSKIQNVNVGDLVLMYYDNMPPMSWPLGRIEKVFPSRDGTVRVVQVKTSQGTLTRPINKLVALPIV